MTHASWTRAAGKVCSQMYRDGQALAPPQDPNDPAHNAEYSRRFALVLTRAAQSLDELETPDQDRSRASEAARALNNAGTSWQQIAMAFDQYTQDPAGAQQTIDESMQAAADNMQRAGEVFVSVGVEGCSGSATN